FRLGDRGRSLTVARRRTVAAVRAGNPLLPALVEDARLRLVELGDGLADRAMALLDRAVARGGEGVVEEHDQLIGRAARDAEQAIRDVAGVVDRVVAVAGLAVLEVRTLIGRAPADVRGDRKSTRLNSSHAN